MDNTWLQIAQGIPGGLAFLLVVWGVKTKQLRIGYEVEEKISDSKTREGFFRELWEDEKAENKRLVESRDKLVQDLQESSDTLNETAKALQTAHNALLTVMERRRNAE
jgi:uncharacterized protein YoxC